MKGKTTNKKQLIRIIVCAMAMLLSVGLLASCDKAGPQGEPGAPGQDGKSAYELAVENGYTGTVEEWLASLVGEVGATGESGSPGVNGKSAYEIAVEKGYHGTEEEWLASLIGPAGKDGANGQDGANGKDGTNGKNGTNGKSAYDLAVANGFKGSLPEWLDSLVGEDGKNGENGKDGTNGKSAYELAVENGFKGSLTEWLASLVGKDGAAAERGEDGKDGVNGKSAYELAVENGYKGDVQSWLASLVGKDGTNGSDGKNGLSAYEVAVKNGYKGSESDWIASLVGAKGEKGDKGDTGPAGADGKDGVDGSDGKDGVSITNAYVDDDMHLWIELSNGNKIDAGYVGVEVAPQPITYTVTFLDYDGSILKTEIVQEGQNATAPDVPYREGYLFYKWDKSFLNVCSNIEVTAEYIEDKPTVVDYKVTFYDYDGSTVLAEEGVARGSSAVAPKDPTKAGTTFLGWSGTYVNVQKDETVRAVYSDEKNVFVVETKSGKIGDTITILVSVDGVVKTCGFDFSLFYDSDLELISFDGDLDLDTVINDDAYENGLKLNFSSASDKVKQRDIVELTFKVGESEKNMLPIVIKMTSIKEITNNNPVDTSCVIVDGGVVIGWQ